MRDICKWIWQVNNSLRQPHVFSFNALKKDALWEIRNKRFGMRKRK